MWATFFFVIFPYMCFAVFVLGHVWRYRHDQFGWTSRTSQIMEKKWLAWGSPLFHFGALAVIMGHILGLLVPPGVIRWLGISDHFYHLMAVWGGLFAGVVLCAGLVILLIRRFIYSHRVRAVTTRMDYVMYALLTVEIVLGMWQTIAHNVIGSGFDYRGTVSVWFQQLFYLSPDPGMLTAAPFIYGLHAMVAMLIIAIWPFTRLVHVWSVPVAYLARPYVVYRRRGVPDVTPDYTQRVNR